MNILVLIKQTFDTEEKIIIKNGKIEEEGVNFIINPYDEYAVEEAVKLKETYGGDVTIVTVGPARTENAIRTALAMGADRGLHIEQDGEWDEFSIARLIAAAVKNKGFDLVLGGNVTVDSGAGQVAIRVAEQLGIPHVASVVRLDIHGGSATVEREAEGDVEIIEVQLPFLAAAQQGLNEPRYPSLPGIMKAKKKPIDRLQLGDLGMTGDDIKPKTVVIEQHLPPKKEQGKILSGEISAQVKELGRLLRQEAKVV